MAEFSRQYCELKDPEFPWDFDIEEIAKDLKPGYHVPYICEGFGFIAIGKDMEDNTLLYFPDWEDTGVQEVGHWIEYERFMDSEQNRVI